MTIFLSISRGFLARNFLQNDFYRLLKQSCKKIVILTPAYQDHAFIEQFGGPQVEFVPLMAPHITFLDTLFSRVFKFIVYNTNTMMMSGWGFLNNKNRILKYTKYLFLRLIFQPLSKARFIRKFLRYVDYLFLQEKEVSYYRGLIKKYKPDVVFSTCIVDDTEAALIKAARKEGVMTTTLPKSWDNPSKSYFRAKVDSLIVWSEFMSEQMKKYQDYKHSEITIMGVPQFDYYTDKNRILSREEYCRRVGLDPHKKIIFYGSEGKEMPEDVDIVEVIYDFIERKELVEECQIFIRPHFGYKHDHLKFEKFFGKKNVIIDSLFKLQNAFPDQWDYSVEHMNNFLNSIYHASMIVNIGSTLTLDAIALDRPAVVIKFDGYIKKPLAKSVERWYICDYFSELLEYHAAAEAHSVDELREQINAFLKNPDLFKDQRATVRSFFCHAVDGKAGERLFKRIQSLVNV